MVLIMSNHYKRAGYVMKKAFLFLLCCIVLVGCARTRVIDKIGIIHVFGFDQAENGDLIGTALSPDYTADKAGSEILLIEEEAPTTVLLVSKMAAKTSTPLELAKISALVFGKEFAEEGIGYAIDRILLTPQLATNRQIAVASKSAKETLKSFKKEKELTLAERIEHNIEAQGLPEMNMHTFLNHFYGEGMDAYVPILTIDDGKPLKVDGIGVFKDDKLKLHLNPEQTVIFSFLKDNKTFLTYQIELEGKHNKKGIIVARVFQSKQKWKWDRKKEALSLRLKLQLSLTQLPERFDIDKMKDLKEVKKLVAANIEKEINDLLALFKEKEVDPIGIGNIVRTKDRSWNEESFYEKYPSLPIDVNVELEIIHTGLES